jgi:hypothetical protein
VCHVDTLSGEESEIFRHHWLMTDLSGMTSAAPEPEDGNDQSPEVNWPWPLSTGGIFCVAAVVAGLGIIGLVAMWLIANRLHGSDRAQLEIDAIKYGLGFIAAGGAAAALLLNVRRQQLSERSHKLELRKQSFEMSKQKHAEVDAAERRVTELVTRAVDQLGIIGCSRPSRRPLCP